MSKPLSKLLMIDELGSPIGAELQVVCNARQTLVVSNLSFDE